MIGLIYPGQSVREVGLQATSREYMKIGEMKLGEGEHKIEAHGSWLIADSKEKNFKIVLVNKEEREKAEKEIREKINNPKTELCYIFSKRDGEFWVN